MIAFALKVFGWLLTIEFGRVERDDDEPAEILPAKHFRIGFAPDDDSDDQDDDHEPGDE